MAEDVDRRLSSPEGRDRRNGPYWRRLLRKPGDIEPELPRTRRYCPTAVLRSHVRRVREIDRVILAGFVLGLSTRRIGGVLPPLLGRPVPPAIVVRVAGIPDAVFHCRPLADCCKALMPDGVVPVRRTGVGTLRRPVPAISILPDGRKGIIDFQPARGESAAERERPPASLHRCVPVGEGLEVICADGGNGLPAALPLVYPDIPVRRCRAHRIGNGPDKVQKPDREDAKRYLHNIMNAPNLTAARTATRRFADRRRDAHPEAVGCLCDDPDDLPARFRYPSPTGAGRCEPQTPSNGAFGKSGGGSGPWAPSKTASPWNTPPSPSSHTKTRTTEPPPLSP